MDICTKISSLNRLEVFCFLNEFAEGENKFAKKYTSRYEPVH